MRACQNRYNIRCMKNNIKVFRTEKGWSQADLAEQVGVTRNSINAVENGRFEPSLPLVFSIANLFGLKIEEVFINETTAQGGQE